MIKHNKILLTGITGAVGSWIAGEALNQGIGITALMRNENADEAREKLINTLNLTGNGHHIDDLPIIKGDICHNLLPIADNEELADVTVLVHCAASTDFSDNTSDLSHKSNIDGTENVLDLAAKLQVPVCYISTAYIAGHREGVVREDETDVGQTFNNVYEQTKCKAESFVHNWSVKTGLPVYVIRPSIVIGDSEHGRIAAFSGTYHILRFLDTIAPMVAGEEIRAVARKDATKNLIPVDYLAKAICHILEHGEPKTYHITNPNPLTLGEFRDIYSTIFNINGKLVSEEEFESTKPSRSELLYRKVSSMYEPYMSTEPIFDRTNTDEVLKGTDITMPVIDSDYITLILKYAKSVQWGKLQVDKPVS